VSVFHAIVLGITQGLSEFLPISSSGHLKIVPWLFGWDDFAGDDKLEQAFDVALHLGTLVGAVAYLWGDIVRYTAAGVGRLLRREPLGRDGRIAWYLVASAVPAALTGVLLEGVILDLSDRIGLIGVMLILFGFVLWWADRREGTRPLETFTFRDAMGMGLGQALALQPGVSRSGVTITVSRYLGFARDSGARLAFLMSLPVIAGAGLYRAASVAADGGVPSELVSGFIAGMIASAVTGWLAVWGMLRFVRHRTFLPFVIYRFVVGTLLIVLVIAGFRA
jgi:undecaprenyl-diphosphatase